MGIIREQASRITTRSHGESRSRALAGKIGQYAERTDALVEDMQRFAQETPLQLAPVEVKPLLEGALHLSRLDKAAQSARSPGGGDGMPAGAGRFQPTASRFSSDHFECDGRDGRGWRRRAFNLRTCLRNRKCAFSSPIPVRVSGIRKHAFEPFYTTKRSGRERASD